MPPVIMIKKNKNIPDNFFILERCETFGEYARRYGDEIVERFEALDIIYFPFFPLDLDLEFFQALVMPQSLPKPGINNGLDQSVIVRNKDKIEFNEEHILKIITQNNKMAVYIQNQIFNVHCQIREGIRTLFPRYYSLKQGNNTWRFTNIKGTGLHYDFYHDGDGKLFPLNDNQKISQKIKLFINLDSKPRIWHTSYTLPKFLIEKRNSLPHDLPNDLNLLNGFIDTSRTLYDCPHHDIHYPTLSAVMTNTEAVSHHIEHGDRVIGAQFWCSESDMMYPEKNIQKQLPHWLEEGGYKF